MAKKGKTKKHDKNKRIATITLLEEGYAQIWVARHLKVNRRRVSYLKNHPLNQRKRRTKLNESQIDEIVEMAENKPTSEIGSRKISNIMNHKFEVGNIVDKNGKFIKISKSTINVYLKKRNMKPRKYKKTFALAAKQKEKHVKFCKEILEKKLLVKKFFSLMRPKYN